MIVRPVEKVPVARRPAPEKGRATWLAALPRAASEPTERMPAFTVTSPVKVLAPPRTSVPAPAFVIPKEPASGPVIERPWMTFESVALATLKVGDPVSVPAPLKARPKPLLLVTVSVWPPIERPPNWSVLLAAVA